MYLEEGETFGYTVSLTHQPGVREDETVDLQNDEVRIYLTSSQEVYQQDDESSTEVAFQQRVGHRQERRCTAVVLVQAEYTIRMKPLRLILVSVSRRRHQTPHQHQRQHKQET